MQRYCILHQLQRAGRAGGTDNWYPEMGCHARCYIDSCRWEGFRIREYIGFLNNSQINVNNVVSNIYSSHLGISLDNEEVEKGICLK